MISVLLVCLALTGVFYILAVVFAVIKNFWWIVLPIFLAVIAGVTAYYLKKKNKIKAEKQTEELNRQKEIIMHGEKLIKNETFQDSLEEAVVWYKIFENIASGKYKDSVIFWDITPFVDDKYERLVCEFEKPMQYEKLNGDKDKFVYFEMIFKDELILATKETYAVLRKMGDYESAEKSVYDSCFKELFHSAEEAKRVVGGFDCFLEHLSKSPDLDAVLIKGFRTGGTEYEDSLIFIEELKKKCNGIESSAKWHDLGSSQYSAMKKKFM